jgi:hypothetical protein
MFNSMTNKKLVLFFSVLVLISEICLAQIIIEENVPEAIKTEYLKRFPKAKEGYWELLKGNYEVNFMNDTTEYSVVFDKNSNLVEIEYKLFEYELPVIIISSFYLKFPGYKFHASAKIIEADNTVYYMVELLKGKIKLAVLFNSNGDVMKIRDISNVRGHG